MLSDDTIGSHTAQSFTIHTVTSDMTKLEDLKQGAAITGILPGNNVTVVDMQWYGNEAIALTYRDAMGRAGNQLLFRDDEKRLAQLLAGATCNFLLMTATPRPCRRRMTPIMEWRCTCATLSGESLISMRLV